jgi:C4-type Zn-finger protein
VEGILQSVKQDLEETQSQRRLVDPETAEKLDHFIRRIDQCLFLEIPWTLVNHKPYSYRVNFLMKKTVFQQEMIDRIID